MEVDGYRIETCGRSRWGKTSRGREAVLEVTAENLRAHGRSGDWQLERLLG